MPSTLLIDVSKHLDRFTPLTDAQKVTIKAIAQTEGIDNVDTNGRTALMIAVIDRNYELAAFLIELKADKDTTDATGQTAASYFRQNEKKLDIMPQEPGQRINLLLNNLRMLDENNALANDLRAIDKMIDGILFEKNPEKKEQRYTAAYTMISQLSIKIDKSSDENKKTAMQAAIYAYHKDGVKYESYQHHGNEHLMIAKQELAAELNVDIREVVKPQKGTPSKSILKTAMPILTSSASQTATTSANPVDSEKKKELQLARVQQLKSNRTTNLELAAAKNLALETKKWEEATLAKNLQANFGDKLSEVATGSRSGMRLSNN